MSSEFFNSINPIIRCKVRHSSPYRHCLFLADNVLFVIILCKKSIFQATFIIFAVKIG